MMSESDDTDVLLLIPPDLFLVPSSDSEDSDYRTDRIGYGLGAPATSVVTELFDQVQSLENRMSVIESKDTSLDASFGENQFKTINPSPSKHPRGQLATSRNRFSSVSQISSLLNTPTKPRQTSSVPSTPSNNYSWDARSSAYHNYTNASKYSRTNSIHANKLDELSSQSEPSIVGHRRDYELGNMGIPHASGESDNRDIRPVERTSFSLPPALSQGLKPERSVKEMELSEVDELLHEMENTEAQIARRINDRSMYQRLDVVKEGNPSPARRLEFSHETNRATVPFDEDSLHLDETDKMISEFKMWRQNCVRAQGEGKCLESEADAGQKLKNVDGAPSNNDNSIASHGNILKAYTKTEPEIAQVAQVHKQPHSTCNLLGCTTVTQSLGDINRISNDVGTNTENSRILPHRLLTLSDFWENDPTKSQEDMLRIKLEEEKFRRDHCEHLIQELQKRLLEQQEKVAVAVRVDNEKNVVIMRLQNAWTKLKLRWQVLEAESNDLQLTLKNVKDKHEMECEELRSQIKRCEGELSKALDLAAGYKEKSDEMTEERVDSLKKHADELENYKSLVQEAEARYGLLKVEYNKVSNQNQQLGEALKNTQQEVNRERLRGGEVRGEMGVIHKALDACEAELIVLRQEKESLQLKLKEEVNRNHILEQNKNSFLAVIDEAKNAERTASEEAKSLASQQEKMRMELREVYQKQVDEVVKAKLHEFQSQLDAAESAFQSELESRQRAIAECAARKIKTVLDKHQLEINLLEEKHKEEKRLYEIQLAQSMQQVSMLDSKLNNQQAKKTQLAEQLHSVMQRQWQQALQIISGGNMDNSPSHTQRHHAEKLFESKNLMKSESSPNIGSNMMEPMRLESHSMPVIDAKAFSSARLSGDRDATLISTNSTDETPLTSRRDQSKDDLRKYIKMILDMQQPKSNFIRPLCPELSPSPKPIYREVPRKHYMKKEDSFISEDSSVIWQPSSEISAQEAPDYISFPQKLTAKDDQQKVKPPWK